MTFVWETSLVVRVTRRLSLHDGPCTSLAELVWLLGPIPHVLFLVTNYILHGDHLHAIKPADLQEQLLPEGNARHCKTQHSFSVACVVVRCPVLSCP